jgi:hypothetical protein
MLSFSASALAYNAGSRSVVLTGRRAPAAAMVDCLENAMVYDCGPTATSAGVSSGCVFFPEPPAGDSARKEAVSTGLPAMAQMPLRIRLC